MPMNRSISWTLGAVATLALLAVPSTSEAQQTRNWLVCGGNHFDTCASVFAEVGPADALGVSNVELKIWNLSGVEGTYEGTVFTKVGFFHQNHSSGGVIEAQAVDGSIVMTGPTDGNNPAQWELGDPNTAGGIELDLAANNGDGVSDGIANACDTSLLPGGQNSFWLNPCATGGFDNDPNAAGWIVITFNITGTWDLATSELLVFGQNGPDELSTQCITGDGGNCNPPTTVPEPGSLLLLATGVIGLGLVGIRRRRFDELS